MFKVRLPGRPHSELSEESFGLVYDAVWPSHMGTITGVINCRLGEGTKANLSLDSEIKSKKNSFVF